MDLGEVYINIKVRKVDLPDDLVKFVNDGVEVVKELKKCREEIQELKGRIGKVEWNEFLNKMTVRELKDKVDKLEGDLEYAKCGGWLNRFVYPAEPFYPDYPIITYSYNRPEIVITDIFKATT